MKGWIIGIVIVILVMGGIFLFTGDGDEVSEVDVVEDPIDNTLRDDSDLNQGPIEVEFDVVAKRYDFSPSEIRVNEGEMVKIRLTSEDVTHGFKISEFGVNAQVSAGETEMIEFVADKKGTFTFSCSVFCGSGHGGMNGILIVE